MMVRSTWLLTLFALSGALQAEPLLRAQVEASYGDNLNNANLGAQKKSDYAALIQLSAGQIFHPVGDDTLSVAAILDTENYHEFTGLDATGAGIQLGYTHKLGLGLEQPRFHLTGSAVHHNYRNAVRDGWLYTTSAGLSKRWRANWAGQLFYTYERRTQDSVEAEVPGFSGAVFDQSAHTLAVDIHYFCSDDTVLSAGYARRSGDVTATTRPGYSIYRAASALADDAVFGEEFYAYRLHALAHTAYVEVSQGVSAHSSVNLRYQRSMAYGANDFNYYGSRLSLNWRYEY